MIRFRVDDYPGTKPEEFYRHNLENFKKFHDVMMRHGARYVLGIIPRHAPEDDCRWIGSQDGIEPALHGVDHDERFPNEFRDHQTEAEVCAILSTHKARLEALTGRQVSAYIPPHNVVDRKTVNALVRSGFKELWGGPESKPDVLAYASGKGLKIARCMPPVYYGRSDELLPQWRLVRPEFKVDVGLHWTWEWNIGLQSLDEFLSQIKGAI